MGVGPPESDLVAWPSPRAPLGMCGVRLASPLSVKSDARGWRILLGKSGLCQESPFLRPHA